MVVIVNYFNTKEMARLSKMSTVERLEVDNSKVINIGNNSNKIT